MEKRCKDIVGSGSGYALVLDDDDIKRLLELRAAKNYQGVNDVLTNKFRSILL